MTRKSSIKWKVYTGDKNVYFISCHFHCKGKMCGKILAEKSDTEKGTEER